jgi:hypothetical protein
MAVRTAKVGQVTGEINSMAQALADFRTKTGAYPPSRILLSERGTYTIDATTQAYATGIADITDGQLAQRSVTWLRRIWPRAAFTVGTTGSPPAAPTIPGPLGFHDFNGNNAVDPPYVLTGDECLVFFLGGIPSKITTPGGGSITFGLNGFNREPSNPFIANTVILGSNTYSFSSRVPALYEFKADRLETSTTMACRPTPTPWARGKCSLIFLPMAAGLMTDPTWISPARPTMRATDH